MVPAALAGCALSFLLILSPVVDSGQTDSGSDPQATIRKATRALEAGRPTEAERLFRRVLESHPGILDAYLGLADAISAQGRRTEAAHVLLEAGRAFLEGGEVGAARKVLERAVQLYPGSADAHYDLGRALMREEAFVDASHHLQRALELGERALAARFYLGAALWERGQLEEAERAYREAVET
ncbi:MAG: tetratricopeptide repeat protein, partial [Acidobacteriota bacterium]